MTTLMSSRQFNQQTSAAKKACETGPVVVTQRGRPEHVLLTYDAYLAMTGGAQSLAQACASLPDVGDTQADFPRSRELPRAAVFD